MKLNRRGFLGGSTAAGAGLAWGAGAGLLALGAEPTAPSGELGAYGEFLAQRGEARPAAGNQVRAGNVLRVTENNILGPYYRTGAPFRGKVTPPLAAGDPLLIRGQVWGYDTRKPLAGVILDIWQADADGRYDNDDPKHPPAGNEFTNRTRLVTDDRGRYEFETVHPGRYQIGTDLWRPSHIHYLVAKSGYKTLVTQLYFAGDPYNDQDEFIKKSLIIAPAEVKTPRGSYHSGTFDIVLDKP